MFSSANGLFARFATFKNHLRTHCKPAYQRQNKDHYKDNLLTAMQVFGNATDFSLSLRSGLRLTRSK
jgi:hypothetical protein